MHCKGQSPSIFYSKAIFTDKPLRDPYILFSEKPIFTNIKELIQAKAVVFNSALFPYSHETLLFEDYYVPYIHKIDKNIKELLGKEVIIYCDNGVGQIFTEADQEIVSINKSHKTKSNYCFSSNIAGMRFCKDTGATKVATRGEFMYWHTTSLHPKNILDGNKAYRKSVSNRIKKVLGFGARHFNEVFYRFSDFTDDFLSIFDSPVICQFKSTNPSLGNRGTFRLLNDYEDIFKFETKVISDICKQVDNISVVLPYVRTHEEAKAAQTFIRKTFNGKIGCMIEVPSFFYNANKIEHLFDFFIIGCSDLLQLIQGSDRNSFEFHENSIKFLSHIVEDFLNSIDCSRVVYITSAGVYNSLTKQYSNVYLLSKS